jgi:hypothetical protein
MWREEQIKKISLQKKPSHSQEQTGPSKTGSLGIATYKGAESI